MRPGAFLDQMPQAARPARPRPEDPAARRRRIGAILLAIVAALAIAAVLSSAGGVESGDVADVEDAGTVSKQDFDHWLIGRLLAAPARAEEALRAAEAGQPASTTRSSSR